MCFMIAKIRRLYVFMFYVFQTAFTALIMVLLAGILFVYVYLVFPCTVFHAMRSNIGFQRWKR